jgi:hypothetical protein
LGEVRVKLLDCRVDANDPLIETQQGGNAVVVTGGVTRLHPAGLLTQKLDAVRACSSDVWKRIEGHS